MASVKHVMGSLDSGFVTTKLEALLSWARKYSLFQYPFVTACCGMEFMSLNGPVYDGLARFGAGPGSRPEPAGERQDRDDEEGEQRAVEGEGHDAASSR